jgi:hypothetical protein
VAAGGTDIVPLVIGMLSCLTINPATRRLVASLMALTCAAVLSPPLASAAPPTTLAKGGQHELVAAAAATNRELLIQLAGSVRDLRRSADQTVREPSNPFFRINFTGQRALLSSLIGVVRRAGGLTREANAAQLVVAQENRRVRAAWDLADQPSEVAAAVQQLESLTADAAKASGARTNEEINAFKKAHLSDVRYAGRRWLVDRAVGRQGAVIMSRGVRNGPLRRAIESLYRPGAKVGDGGTADALLSEVKVGCRGGGCKHFLKAGERRASLIRILSEQPLSTTERQIAGELVGALTKAIRVAGGK